MAVVVVGEHADDMLEVMSTHVGHSIASALTNS